MRTWVILIVVLAPCAAHADPSPVGDAGESCRARADCAPGLHCVDGVCTAVKKGTSTGFSLADGPLHPFMGWTLTGGFTLTAVTGEGPAVGGINAAFRTAVNAGFFVGRHQVTVDVGLGVLFSSQTNLFGQQPIMTTEASTGAVDVVVSYAYLLRLARWV
jgi:hypothetical protein